MYDATGGASADFTGIDMSSFLDFSNINLSGVDILGSLANIDYAALAAMADPNYWIDLAATDIGPIPGDGKLLGETNTTFGQGPDEPFNNLPVDTYVPPDIYVPPTGGGGSTPTPPPPPTPPTPPPPPKTATPQYITFNDKIEEGDYLFDLLLESVGGQELLSVARLDTVNGQDVIYQPLKNLGIIQEQYNPNNLIQLQKTSDKFFANYSIKLSEKIPNVGNGLNGDNVYLDTDGNLIIEFINLASDEQIEVQITTDGTIYEAGI